MAAITSEEVEIYRTAGNQLNFSAMTRLADGRILSVGQTGAQAGVRLTDTDTGAVTEVEGLDARALSGSVVQTLHNVMAAALPDGGFVVGAQVNQNIGTSFSNYEQVIYLQFYNADGTARGEPVRGRDPDTDPGIMSTTAGNATLLETPEGVVLLFKQQVGILQDANRPGLIARFFDPQGEQIADHALFTERGDLPAGAIVEGDQIMLVWAARRDSSTRPEAEAPPAGAYVQQFGLDGAALGPRQLIDEVEVPLQARLLVMSDDLVKLFYLAGNNPIDNGPLALRVVDLDSDGRALGPATTLLRYDQAPAGEGNWRMIRFDVAPDGDGGFVLALQAQVIGATTRDDVFVAGFDADGSLRGAPALSSQTDRGIQQDPVLIVQDDGTLFLQFMQFERPEISGATQLIGVQVTPGATTPEPDPEPDPLPDPLPGPGPDHGLVIAAQLTLSGGSDPAGVVVTFRSDDGETLLSVSASADGTYRFDAAPDIAGRLEATKAWDPASDPGISAVDALEVLRMAVGLAPSFGAATPRHFIAADIDGDGSITPTDALEILRAAVGLDSTHAPRWVFVDPAVDLSGVSAGQIGFEAGVAVTGLGDLDDLAMTGILLGSLVNQT